MAQRGHRVVVYEAASVLGGHVHSVDVECGEPVPVRDEGTEIDFPDTEPLLCECQAFIEAMDSRESPLTDAQSALRVLRVLEAAQRSLFTSGAPVALPLQGVR